MYLLTIQEVFLYFDHMLNGRLGFLSEEINVTQFVAYYRVSTQRQGRSGLGLDAQRESVSRHVLQTNARVLAEFVEIETARGADALQRRPKLRDAVGMCRRDGATLLIAKLDRLARNVHFVSGLIESGVDFVAADMPQANKVMIQMHAVMAEWERDQISLRTRAALAEAKKRGVQLGKAGPNNLRHHNQSTRAAADSYALRFVGQLEGFRLRGLSQRRIVAELNQMGIGAPRGGEWSLYQVQRLIQRIESCSRATTLPSASRIPSIPDA
jgi:DNA invertase Pin-like site-specific DNA recombinase